MNLNNEGPSMQRPARPPGVPPRKPCAFFMKTGQCRYGDKCRFSHERPDAAPNGMANENSTNSKKQGQRICTTFQRTGSCKFGNKCHFLHERGPQTETTDKSSSSTADPAGIFQMLTRRKMANCTSQQIAQFVRVCTECFAQPGDGAKTEILNTLSSKEGQDMLSNMFGKSKTFVLETSDNNLQISVTKDFFPFLKFAISKAVLDSDAQSNVNGFLQFLGRSFDWKKLLPVLDELLFKDEQDSDLFEMVNCFVSFVLELIRRFDDDFFEEVESLLQTLTQLADLLQEEDQPTRAQRQLKTALLELTNSVRLKTNQAELVAKLTKALEDKAKQRKQEARAKPKAFSIIPYQTPPGSFRPEGPRHDNDHASIETITIVPTEEEVLCQIPPYLPPNKAGVVAHLPRGSVEAHRDLHFRLLRHNLIADINSALVAFREDDGIKGLQERDKKKTNQPLRRGPHEVQTDIYRKAEVKGIKAELNSGVYFDVTFEQLPMLTRKDHDGRLAYWKKSRRLQFGTLACLCWESGVERKLNIVFGMIADRKLPALCKSRPIIGLKCLPDPYNSKLLNLMKAAKPSERRSEIILLQTGPCFFAYQPVLEALKKVPIPLSQYITQPPIDKAPGEQAPVGPGLLNNTFSRIRGMFANQQTVQMKSPKYYQNGAYFDLSFICKTPTRAPSNLRQVMNTRGQRFPVNEIVAHSTLDMPQAEALKTALTHELAIIQGPPGTGKTFLAIQVMRALVSFVGNVPRPVTDLPGASTNGQPSLAPILCVCFTNHALDQFLVGLMDAGITGIVRVGGNSKTEKLEKCNLKNLEKPNLGRKGYKLRHETLPELEKKISRISPTSDSSTNTGVPDWSQIQDLILALSSRFLDSLANAPRVNKNSPRPELSELWSTWWNQFSGRTQIVRVNHDRPINTLLEFADIWNLSQVEHERLRGHWIQEYLSYMSNGSQRLITQYENQIEEYRALQRESNVTCLQKATVIGMTTTYVAKNQKLLEGIKPKVVMLEEAAEVLEAHVLTCLCEQTEHIILIGDHLQLRPKVDQYMLQATSGSGFDLDISLFERMVTQNDLPFATLQTQRRMRPQFSQLIRPTVYPHLTDHESVRKYPKSIPGMVDTLYFLDHDHKQVGADEGKSHSNEFEAHFAVELAAYIAKQQCFTEEDIAIITPYVGQLLTIRNLLTKTSISVTMSAKDEELMLDMLEKDGTRDSDPIGGLDDKVLKTKKKLNNCVRLATIDNFQGEEAKVIILSLVRNDKDGRIGFLGEKSRINVLLSRAKWGMYLLGNAQSLVNCTKSDMWKQVIDILKAQNCIGPSLKIQCQNHPDQINEIKDWKDFQTFAPGGGCQLQCQEQLPCGHVCPRRCHLIEQDHSNVTCNHLVSVQLPCLHIKNNVPCHQARRKISLRCEELVEVTTNDCQFGHKHQVRCHKAEEFKKNCNSCTALLSSFERPSCGHELKAKCCEWKRLADDPCSCKEVCGMDLACGHKCKRPCGNCMKHTQAQIPNFRLARNQRTGILHLPCQNKCGKLLLCGHDCEETCHDGIRACGPCKKPCPVTCHHRSRGCRHKCCEPCVPCAMECGWECEHQDKCPLPCGAPCIRLPCDRRCEKLLSCGCRCPCICGEQCPSSDYCLTHGSENVKAMCVDMIMLRTYEELTDQDLIEDPLVVLNCGHAFLASTLDGHMGLETVYTRDRFDRWLEPKLGDTFLQFEQRKTCMQCRVPITSIRRYGRVINKTNLDLMERAFFQKCETKLQTLQQRLETIVIKEDISAQDARNPQTLDMFRKQCTDLEKYEKEYHNFIIESKNPPSAKLYEKTKDCLLGHLQNEGIQPGQSNQERSFMPIPRPDISRPCKGYIGLGQCHRKFITLQSQILRCLEIMKPPRAPQDHPIMRDVALAFETGRNKVLGSCGMIEKSLEHALHSGSNTRIVDACQSALSIHSASLKFTLEIGGAVVAQAMNQNVRTHDNFIHGLKQHIITHAEGVLNQAYRSCTNTTQRNQINQFNADLKTMKQISETPSHAEQMRILRAVLVADPRIQASNPRGHIHRCPNDHWFVIGECGGPMEVAICPDCGSRVGGTHHNFLPGQSRTRDSDLAEFHRQ